MMWKEVIKHYDVDNILIFWNGNLIYKKWIGKDCGLYKGIKEYSLFFDKYGGPLRLDGTDN